jgi:hypothetical protein
VKQRIYDAPYAEKFWCIVWSILNECNRGDYDCHYGCILGDICGKYVIRLGIFGLSQPTKDIFLTRKWEHKGSIAKKFELIAISIK